MEKPNFPLLIKTPSGDIEIDLDEASGFYEVTITNERGDIVLFREFNPLQMTIVGLLTLLVRGTD